MIFKIQTYGESQGHWRVSESNFVAFSSLTYALHQLINGERCEHMYADFHRHCALAMNVIRKLAIFCIVVYTVEKNANKD